MSRYQWRARRQGADYYNTDTGFRVGFINTTDGSQYTAHAFTHSRSVVPTDWWVQLGDSSYEYLEAKRLVEVHTRLEN